MGWCAVSSKEQVRDGVKLENVVLHTNWLLLSGPGELSSLIKGALLHRLRVLSSMVVELGSGSKSRSIFSCAMSSLKLSSGLSRFSGSRSRENKSTK